MRWIQGLINLWNMIFTEESEIEIESHSLFYYMTLNQIWITPNSADFVPQTPPVSPMSVIINLIVYQK
jgi:hypothetical protein